MRYFVTVFVNNVTRPLCNPNGYENLALAQILAMEISRGVNQTICVENRCGNEVMFAERFENGRRR